MTALMNNKPILNYITNKMNHNFFAGRTMLSSSPLINLPLIYFSKMLRD